MSEVDQSLLRIHDDVPFKVTKNLYKTYLLLFLYLFILIAWSVS